MKQLSSNNNAEPTVVLWGVCHHLQRGYWVLPPADVGAFLALVCSRASHHGVVAIAEEMSRDAMQLTVAIAMNPRGVSNAFINKYLQGVSLPSIPEQAAHFLGLGYRACDPGTEERRRLGIPECADDPTDPEQQDCRAKNGCMREYYWLQCLKDFAQWPVLYLCGEEHIETFRKKLLSEGIKVVKCSPTKRTCTLCPKVSA